MESENNIEAAYETIRNARELKKNLKPSTASEATLKMYDREVQRLLTKYQTRSPDQLFAAVCDTASKLTYYKRLAAIKNFVQARLADALSEQDKRQRAGDSTAWLSSVAVLDFLVELHKTIEGNRGKCPLTSPKPRKSKRRSLRALPANFREQMCAAMKISKYRLPILVAALTGCRPAEIETGVKVSVNEAEITLQIIGAKVKADGTQGQAWRAISYSIDSDHQLVRALIDELRMQNAVELSVSVESKVNFTSALRRTGRLLWPKNSVETTGYTLRHRFASDCKAHFLDADQVSMALGHAVDRTSSTYGQSQMAQGGSGMLRPSGVSAASPIKATRSEVPKNRIRRPRR